MAPGAVENEAELLGWSPRRTGHSLPDGTPVTVYVQFSPEGAAISDLGGTLASIDTLPSDGRASIEKICHTNDVQIERGSLVAHVPPGGELSEAIDRLGRVCAQISRTASEAATSPR
jgi:hypothetical protein